MSLLLDPSPSIIEQTEEKPNNRHCDCHHERLTDGIHHYLDLPGEEDEQGMPVEVHEHIADTDGFYIGLAWVEATPCFLRPSWAASFRGPSEAGEISPSLRLLCDWCKNHWAKAPQVYIRSL